MAKITTGNKTKAQIKSNTTNNALGPYSSILTTYSTGNPPGFGRPDNSTFILYRKMMDDPTVSLAFHAATARILSANWNFKANKNAPSGALEFIQEQWVAMKDWFVKNAIDSMVYGFQPFEKVWTVKEGMLVIEQLKPLLQDYTQIVVDNNSGSYLGLLADKGNTALDPDYSLVITYNKRAGDMYGHSRLESIKTDLFALWQMREYQGQLQNRVAKGKVIVRFAPGSTTTRNGVEDNVDVARKMGENYINGNSIVIPNTLTEIAEDLLKHNAGIDPKALRKWDIEVQEVGAENQAAFVDSMQHKQSLICAGMLVPARAITESQASGSRADSESQQDVGIAIQEWTLRDIIREANWYVTNHLLELNYGPNAMGTVYAEPEPLVNEKKQLLVDLMKLVLSPQNIDFFTNQVDVNSILDQLGVPKNPEPVLTMEEVLLQSEASNRGDNNEKEKPKDESID